MTRPGEQGEQASPFCPLPPLPCIVSRHWLAFLSRLCLASCFATSWRRLRHEDDPGRKCNRALRRRFLRPSSFLAIRMHSYPFSHRAEGNLRRALQPYSAVPVRYFGNGDLGSAGAYLVCNRMGTTHSEVLGCSVRYSYWRGTGITGSSLYTVPTTGNLVFPTLRLPSPPLCSRPLPSPCSRLAARPMVREQLRRRSRRDPAPPPRAATHDRHGRDRALHRGVHVEVRQ